MTDLEYTFDEMKAAQAASFLISTRGRGMKRLRLIKLLHFADRRTIEEIGHPITGDHYVSMEYGIILDRVYNLIKDNSETAHWSKYITQDRHRNIQCTEHRHYGALSRYERRVLQETLEAYGDESEDVLSDISHDFAEWEDVGASSKPVDMDKMFSALNMTRKKQKAIAEEELFATTMSERHE